MPPVTADLTRFDDWLAFLRTQGEADPDIRVIWVGGSAATGGWDEWSDLDVEVLCTPGETTPVYDRILTGARARFAIDHLWELPLAAWPDGRQCFVNLQSQPGALQEPTRIIDLHLADCTDTHRHVDVRRHGTPIVLHDPDDLVVLRHDDQAGIDRAVAEAVDQARQRRATAEWLVNRAIVRGKLPEAVDLYLRFGLGVVVRLLRVRHCPWRHDYGLRYLHTDLPAADAARVTELLPGNASLAELSAACFTWMDELLATMEEQPVG